MIFIEEFRSIISFNLPREKKKNDHTYRVIQEETFSLRFRNIFTRASEKILSA